MAHQTTITEDRSAEPAPLTDVARNMSDVVQTLRRLANLQARLLMLDLKISGRRMILPVVLSLAGAGFILGGFPVLLASLAWLLSQTGGLPHALALLIATVVGMLLGGALLGAGALLFRENLRGLRRLQQELVENLRDIKDAMSHGDKH